MQWTISIHAPLAGSDDYFNQLYLSAREFQSTLPLRGATKRIRHGTHGLHISIHAPLAGSDHPPVPTFCPHPAFQSTLPLRGATALDVRVAQCHVISIHAPLAGSDLSGLSGKRERLEISIHAPLAGSDCLGHTGSTCWCHFNPRSPCGERLTITRPIR